jgi:C-terminal processing protease CtpA/Prc
MPKEMRRAVISAFLAASISTTLHKSLPTIPPKTIDHCKRASALNNIHNSNRRGEIITSDDHYCELHGEILQSLPYSPARLSKKKITSASLSLLFSCVLLLGNIDAPTNIMPSLQSTAFAVESAFDGESYSQTSSWPPTSDQDIFKQPQNIDLKASESTPNLRKRYWDVIKNGSTDEVMTANEKLIDSAVATINTMYYDSSGGFAFDPKMFYDRWRKFRYQVRHGKNQKSFPAVYENAFATRENTVKTMKWLVSSIGDPYSKYLTREELTKELIGGDDGFLGLGALVDVPSSSDNEFINWSLPESSQDWNSILSLNKASNRDRNGQWKGVSMNEMVAALAKQEITVTQQLKLKNKEVLSVHQASNLPVIKAIVPDSPAERVGLVVGDRIASVGTYQFTGLSRQQVVKALDTKFHAENYFGQADLTVAKPIMTAQAWDTEDFEDGWYQPKRSRPSVFQNRRSEQVVAFKTSHVKSIPTTLTAGTFKRDNLHSTARSEFPAVIGGDAIVHYSTLTSNDSIFQENGARPVGYIRLTRFSKASTAGYINAINSLEAAGVDSYIIDLRNNYGGVIQEAMLTASTLLRDPHSVLCYTLNGRGGMRPQENMEYIVDKNYPGYFLSLYEPKNIALEQVRKEHPEYLEDGWTSPTSYASLRELKETRGIKPARTFTYSTGTELKTRTEMEENHISGLKTNNHIDLEKLADIVNHNSQKKVVILINEGTGETVFYFILRTLSYIAHTTLLYNTISVCC